MQRTRRCSTTVVGHQSVQHIFYCVHFAFVEQRKASGSGSVKKSKCLRCLCVASVRARRASQSRRGRPRSIPVRRQILNKRLISPARPAVRPSSPFAPVSFHREAKNICRVAPTFWIVAIITSQMPITPLKNVLLEPAAPMFHLLIFGNVSIKNPKIHEIQKSMNSKNP